MHDASVVPYKNSKRSAGCWDDHSDSDMFISFLCANLYIHYYDKCNDANMYHYKRLSLGMCSTWIRRENACPHSFAYFVYRFVCMYGIVFVYICCTFI